MRLRDSFEGYKLTSGHFMFHMAYYFGSKIAIHHVLDDPCGDQVEGRDNERESCDVLYQLNYAHLLVPAFTFLTVYCDKKGYCMVGRIFDIISIFQYHATIFYA